MRFIHRRTPGLNPVGPHQLDGLEALCALSPVESIALAHQVNRWERWTPGDVVVAGPVSRPDAAAWATGSAIPFGLAPRPGLDHDGASRRQVEALSAHIRMRVAARGSVYGPAGDVEPLWAALAESGLRAREERWNQPLLVAPAPAGGLAAGVKPRRPGLGWVMDCLHAAGPDEESLVLPASVAMFTAELGYDPTAAGASYSRHVQWLVAQGRSYVVMDDGAGHPPAPDGPRQVVFKADVGAVWTRVPGRGTGVAQLTGVWTRPDQRGRGLARAGLAATVDAVRRDHVGAHGTVSLYVNDFNTAALGLYRSLGFERAGTFYTILL